MVLRMNSYATQLEQWTPPERLHLVTSDKLPSDDRMATHLEASLAKISDGIRIPASIEDAWGEYEATRAVTFTPPKNLPPLPTLIREARQQWKAEQATKRRAAFRRVYEAIRAEGPALEAELRDHILDGIHTRDEIRWQSSCIAIHTLRELGALPNLAAVAGVRSLRAIGWRWAPWHVGDPVAWHADMAPTITATALSDNAERWRSGYYSAEMVIANLRELGFKL